MELFHEVGYPAGLNHTMTLDVTGKVLPGDRRIRISSNMEIYWDRICLATALAANRPSQESRGRAAPIFTSSAIPREYSPDGRQPNLYDYHNLDRTCPGKPWRATTPGLAT